jgi:transposase
MMGACQRIDPKLFYAGFSLDERIPDDHFLRRLRAALDLDFVRPAVAQCYGRNGNESIDPIVLVKLMLLLFLEDVGSERQLVKQLGCRLDWLWFCGLDLDSDIPNHSVLSKARRRWGVEIFESLFCRVLEQCIAAGLVEGRGLHIDASCIDGNVDKGKLQPVRLAYQELDKRLDEPSDSTGEAEGATKDELTRPNSRLTASSDREAGVTRSYGQTVCGYKDHRSVDDAHGIITATVTTDAATNEGHVLEEVLDTHEAHTGQTPQLVAADKQYGKVNSYRQLHDRNIKPCIPRQKTPSVKGKFSRDEFSYDRRKDCFVCPAGKLLHRYSRDQSRRRIRYRAAAGVCQACQLRSQCTDSKHGRCVERHMDQCYIDWADDCLSAGDRRYWMKRRKSVVEGSFADGANNHGFKRARWRGLARMTMQNLLIATCQNLRKLLKNRLGRAGWAAEAIEKTFRAAFLALESLWFGLCRRLSRIRRHDSTRHAPRSQHCLLEPI